MYAYKHIPQNLQELSDYLSINNNVFIRARETNSPGKHCATENSSSRAPRGAIPERDRERERARFRERGRE